ncbi:MAG: PQQ-binding-like beta-propeller repeat protein [Alphaproteobacteria bacterium]
MNRGHDSHPRGARRAGQLLARTTLALAATLASLVVSAPASARRCSYEQQVDPCLGQNPVCPAVATRVGPSNSEWPLFQHDQQHTGKTNRLGPSCAKQLWTQKLRGPMFAAPAIGPPLPGGADGVVYVATAKYPVCALNPANGLVLWCRTTDIGKLPDHSAPAVGNGKTLYVGTRDNDLWAIDADPLQTTAKVPWRQKVCTDGDVSTPPLIGDDGTVYAGSDSLSAGTALAMCPGDSGQIRWCINPVGGGIKTVSPALSPDQSVVYYTTNGIELRAFDAAVGTPLWSVQVETTRNGARLWNFTPVVNPLTGRIYLGFDTGLWAVDPPASPSKSPTARLLFGTRGGGGEVMASPPAIDVENDRIFLGAANRNHATFYALDLSGKLLWSAPVGLANMRNTPPVVDAAGNVYLAAGRKLVSWTKDGRERWSLDDAAGFTSSPVIGRNRLYVGNRQGRILAIGGC